MRRSWASVAWCHIISTPWLLLLTAESPPADAFCPDWNQNTFWPKDVDKAPNSWQKNENRGQTQTNVFRQARLFVGVFLSAGVFGQNLYDINTSSFIQRQITEFHVFGILISWLCLYTVKTKQFEAVRQQSYILYAFILKFCLWVCPTFTTTHCPTDQTWTQTSIFDIFLTKHWFRLHSKPTKLLSLFVFVYQCVTLCTPL